MFSRQGLGGSLGARQNFRAISPPHFKPPSAQAPGGLHKVQSSTASDNDQSRMRMGGCRA
jgi:hypothetical protein